MAAEAENVEPLMHQENQLFQLDQLSRSNQLGPDPIAPEILTPGSPMAKRVFCVGYPLHRLLELVGFGASYPSSC